MNLLPSPDQTQILDTLTSFLAEQMPIDRLRDFGAIGNPDAGFFQPLAELGFMGLGLAEDDGGIGLGAAEEMLSFTEYGRALVSPEIFGLTLGAHIAAQAKNDALREKIISGACRIGLANPRHKAWHMIEATEASHVLLVERKRAALIPIAAVKARETVDSTDASISLERAEIDLKHKGIIWTKDDSLCKRACLLQAAYCVGIAEATRDMAVDYAKLREQFGKPIGSFQAIKHICADMAIRAEAALCQARFAALAFDQVRSDTDFHATSAKIVGVSSATKNAAANIQVHGAFGFTAEADAHHYLKRAHLIDMLWGDVKAQREYLLSLPAAN